jgi:hypothetical protein
MTMGVQMMHLLPASRTERPLADPSRRPGRDYSLVRQPTWGGLMPSSAPEGLHAQMAMLSDAEMWAFGIIKMYLRPGRWPKQKNLLSSSYTLRLGMVPAAISSQKT